MTSHKHPTEEEEDNDKSLLKKAYQGVRPLKKKSTLACPSTPPKAIKPPRQPWQDTEDSVAIDLSWPLEPVSRDSIINYRSAEMPTKSFQKLQRGDYPPIAELDLHGQTAEQAWASWQALLQEALHQQWRCLLVIHGKGYRSQSDHPKLKNYVAKWLQDEANVLAYASAQPRDGGSGSLYVWLRQR